MENELPLFLQGMFFAILLAAASIWDIRKRIIPDTLCLSIALAGLLNFEPLNLLGLFAAVPMLMTALFRGGMGGGDIKLMAAAGLVLGFQKSMAGMIMGFAAMLVFHAAHTLIQKVRRGDVRKSYPLVPFLSLGCLAAYYLF